MLPEFRWPTARTLWPRVEELGFDHAWTYDHLAWRSLRDATWFGAVPFLAAAAVVTERIRLGTLVASPNFRHPVPFARELVTLDDLSGGRITLGIGAGADGWDAVMLGQDPWSPAERADRFARVPRPARPPAPRARDVVRGRGSTPPSRPAPIRGACSSPGSPSPWRPRGVGGCGWPPPTAQTWVTTGDLGPEGVLLGAEEGCAVVRDQMAPAGRSLRGGGPRPRVDRPPGPHRPPPRSRVVVARRLR